MRRTIALCALLAASVAWAAKDPVPAVADAFAEGNFEKTVKLADAALRRRPDPEIASRLQLLRGQALSVLNKEDKAKDAFRAALQLDAEAALNPDTSPPDQLELFESARSEVLGIVSVRANDPSALVRIDDKPFGPAPVKAEVPVGKHEIEVTAGERSARETTMVQWKKTVEVSLTLPDAPSPVAATDTPPIPEPKETASTSVTPAAVDSAADAQATTKVKPSGGKGGSIALLGSGVVLMAAGGVGGWYALDVKNQYDRQQNPATIPTVTRAEAQRAATIFPASIAAGAVGLGLVVGGVIGLASGGGDEVSTEGAGGGLTVFPTADGAQLLVEGRF